MTTKIDIDKFPVLASAPVNWALRAGTQPVFYSFDLIPEHADKLWESTPANKPVTLTVTVDDKTLAIKNLYILHNIPAENENIKRIILADRRFIFASAHISKKYNIRRNIGFKRTKTPDVDSLVNDVVPRVWYAKWSVKDPTLIPPAGIWTAKDVLDDVLGELQNKELAYSNTKPNILYPDGNPAEQLPIENLMLDDNGDNAIGRVLSYLPGIDLYVDYNGDIVVYKKTSGKEKNLVSSKQGGQLPFELVGMGHIEKVDFSRLRPNKVNFYFAREVEMRFNFAEPTSRTDSTPPVDSDSRDLDNVLPLPDFSINMTDPDGVHEICQGTYVTFTDALIAWNTDAYLATISILLDYDAIRQAMLPYVDLWAPFYLAGATQPNAEWSSRIGAIQANFRTLYRIKKAWMDRFQTIKAYRVATVDQASGQRSPAIVYSDFAYTNSQRAFLSNTQHPDVATMDFYHNVFVTADGNKWTNGLISTVKVPTPAIVSVVDADMGVIKLDYAVDKFKLHESIMPGTIIGGPNGDLTDTSTSKAMNGTPAVVAPDGSFTLNFDIPKLDNLYKMSVILTAIPAGSNKNSLDQYHKITIFPADVNKVMGIDVGKSEGPPMDIRIGATIEVARIAWKDNKVGGIQYADEIEKIFKPELGNPDLTGLVTNESDTGLESGASLNQIAKAFACRIYGMLIDRFQGSASGYFNPDLQLQGWSEEIMTEVSQDGKATTNIRLPERIQAIDFLAFLPDSTRALILKLANPTKI